MRDTLVLGAVAYDPKVVTIWDGFLAFFRERGLGFDFVLYENYERQVAAHFAGHIDVAWNSPLAWVQSERIAARLGRRARAIAMRDSDQDLRSVIVTKAGGPESAAELRGKRLGVGAADSPQATLLPLVHLAEKVDLIDGAGLEVVRHDLLVGKHGDHIGGEREAVKALLAGEVDAACVIDSNLELFTREGTASPGALTVIDQTATYDHCNFTVLDGVEDALVARFCELLLGMRYDDPSVRRLLDLEGLKEWRPGRTSGYAALERACDRFGTVQAFVDRVAQGA